MTIPDLKNKWAALGRELNPLSSVKIDTLGLAPGTVEFFRQCGFPSQSAPFLSFVKNSKHDVECINRLTDLYSLEYDFERYISIGSDGSGNPIVINKKNGDQVELLDHEQGFEVLELMNTSVYALAGCLIEYENFVHAVIKENGPDAFLDADFSDQQFDGLRDRLKAIDQHAAESGFWAKELEMLKENRDYYRKNQG